MTSPLIALGAAVSAVALIFGAVPASADAVSDFYKGKRLQMLIGYSSGGGYDQYARTISRHWGRLIPGEPSFVARNLPGAGSMRLTNELFNIVPKDGTVVGTVSRGIVHEELWGTNGVRFKSAEFNWIGSANNEVSVCAFWHTAPAKTLQDFLSNELVVGGTGPGADTDTFPQVMNNVFGTKLKLITGYPGGNDVNFAMERGEVQGRCGWSWSSVVATRPQWLEQNLIHVTLQMALAKHPDLSDVPLVMDLAQNDRQKKILELTFSRQTMGRPYLAPPQVPADRVAALRASFMALMKDEKFVAEATKGRLEINPVSGEEVQALVASMFEAPADIIEASKQAANDAAKTRIEKAVVPEVTITAKIDKVQRNGGRIQWSGDVSKGRVNVGDKVPVTLAGKTVKSADLKEGMVCDFKVQGVETALAIDCK